MDEEACLEGLRTLQVSLASWVSEEGDAPGALVAGADVAYAGGQAHAAAVVWDRESRRVIETATVSLAEDRVYVPGLLAWRELPVLLAAVEKLSHAPDVVLCDGHGRAHPRRCGLACLLGLSLDLPAIGCAKSVLAGRFPTLGQERGSRAPLRDGGEAVGIAVRTRSGVRPVFVSVGHRIALEQAVGLVVEVSRFRVPEPLRAAHQVVAGLAAATGQAGA